MKKISKVRYLCLFLSFCRFVVKSIQCQSRLQSEFVALPLLWDVRGNSARSQLRTVLRVVHGFGVSKFDVKPKTTYFTYFDHHLQFISDIRRITSHFMLEAAMRKLLCLQLRPIFAPNKPCFFHITTLLLTPDYFFFHHRHYITRYMVDYSYRKRKKNV